MSLFISVTDIEILSLTPCPVLDAGIDPDFDWGERGGNLLTNSVQFGHKDIVVLLVERGANVNRSIGRSALFISIVHGHQNIREYLETNDAELNTGDKEFLDRHPFLIKDN